jgi:hypothetical protein
MRDGGTVSATIVRFLLVPRRKHRRPKPNDVPYPHYPLRARQSAWSSGRAMTVAHQQGQ